jgi:hypothetical protein
VSLGSMETCQVGAGWPSSRVVDLLDLHTCGRRHEPRLMQKFSDSQITALSLMSTFHSTPRSTVAESSPDFNGEL